MKKLFTLELCEHEDGKREIRVHAETGSNAQESLQLVMSQLWGMQAADTPNAVPMDPQPGMPLLGLTDPRWYVELGLSGATTLAVRHPSLGWMAFALPPESLAQLRARLEIVHEAASKPTGPAH